MYVLNRRASAAAFAAFLLAIVAACGFEGAATGGNIGAREGDGSVDGSTQGDSASGGPADQKASEAGGDASADASDASDAAPCSDPFTCLKCGPGQVWCPGSSACVSDCKTNCSTEPIGCLSCMNGNMPSVATCVALANATACYNGTNQHCPCAGGNVSLCPGSHQVCNSNQCYGCGESGTDGKSCQLGGGLTCEQSGGGPLDNYRCR